MTKSSRLNKKIKNATPLTVEGIAFKSKLEVMVFKTLKENGFDPKYEERTFLLWQGFRPTIPFFTRDKKHSLFRNERPLIGITYTPDFIFTYNGWTVIVEVKGFQNEVFPYKFKMFRKLLESLEDLTKERFILAEIFTKAQLLEFIAVLKVYGKPTEEN